MKKVLLFSYDEKLFDITNRIIEKKYELIKCTYYQLETNKYPFADAVIMHFDRERMKKGAFEPIVKAKGKLGHLVPILAIIEEGNPQSIFSILEAGAYDYIEIKDNLQKYTKKVEELFLWNWYLAKYEFGEKRQ